MIESHHLFIGFVFGAALMWLVLVGVHKKAFKDLEAMAKKSLEDLGQKLHDKIVSATKSSSGPTAQG